MENQHQFLLEEYKSLRTEIDHYSNQKRQLEIYVVTAILVIYGWVLSATKTNGMQELAIYSPIVIVLFGAYKTYFCNLVIRQQASYIKNHIEKAFLPDGLAGWESFWQGSKKLSILWWGEGALWLFLLVITLWVPFFM